MKRGEIWTVRGSSGWISKARPALIVQAKATEDGKSTVTCLFTTFDSGDGRNRIKVEPTEENGLRQTCYVMTDKLVSVMRDEFGSYVGTLEAECMEEVSDALRVLLGL
jgi:mRNA interferase MazF